jgi:tetratricopeptide (TPR) repeat protein
VTAPGGGSSHIGRDNLGIVITGNSNVVRVGADPGQHLAAGIEHLRLGLHAKALEHFRQAMNAGAQSPDLCYLSAVARLDGRKAFLASLSRIREAEELIRAAVMLQDRGVFHYFLAYLGFDYYARRSLNAPTPWPASLARAWNKGVTQEEIDSLFKLLSVNDPLPRRGLYGQD